MTYKDNKKRALEDLKNYPYLKSSLITLHKRIELLKKLYPDENSTTETTAVAEQINCLSRKLEINATQVSCIDQALSSLSEAEHKLINTYYIHRQRGVVENLSANNFSDRSTLYRRAQKALDHYIFAYFGETK